MRTLIPSPGLAQISHSAPFDTAIPNGITNPALYRGVKLWTGTTFGLVYTNEHLSNKIDKSASLIFVQLEEY